VDIRVATQANIVFNYSLLNTAKMNLATASAKAFELMQKHGLISKGWRFEFDRSKRRFGCCKYRLKKITLSASLTALNDEHHVIDTILHEIAHALTPGAHHGPKWKAKAIEIGCNGERCYDGQVVNQPKGNWTGACPNGHIHQRYKTPTRDQSCGKCSRKYDPAYRIIWRQN
jgi:predicted SprT family Zn-dependent metalloprotease